MRHVLSPNRWSCLPAALAAVLDVDLSVVLDAIGHDGSEVYWPDEDEPFKRRAFHVEELAYAAVSLGYSFTTLSPGFIFGGRPWLFDLVGALGKYDGVLTGAYVDAGKITHAMAWSSTDGRVYDSVHRGVHDSTLATTDGVARVVLSTGRTFEPDAFHAVGRLR